MREVVFFLHLYQPPTQFPEIVDKVVRECYLPLLRLLEDYPRAVLNLNFSGSLLEQLYRDHSEVISRAKSLHDRGQVELLGSAAYHPLMNKIPEDEARRQVLINESFLLKFFGVKTQLAGFFPPEMALNGDVLALIKSLGYVYVLADEVSVFEQDHLLSSRVVEEEQAHLKVVVRNNDLSLAIAYSQARTMAAFLGLVNRGVSSGEIVVAMDGETFGHHRPEQMDFLREFLFEANKAEGEIKLVKISDLISRKGSFERVKIYESSWGESFSRWDDRTNPIHSYQWRLLGLAIKAVKDCPEKDKSYLKARSLLDRGLHSDQFWWAAVNPCWHYKMVQRGASVLFEAVSSLSDLNAEIKHEKEEAEDLFNKITQTGLTLYGDTAVAC